MGTSPYACCLEGCRVREDDFEGGLTSRWDVRSGQWTVVANPLDGNHVLREAGNSGALIIDRCSASSSNDSFHVSVSTPSVPEGAVYRLIVNYVDDDNYHYADFDFTNGLAIRLARRAGGSSTVLLERSWSVNMVGSPNTFGVCFSAKEFDAGQLYEPFEAWIVDPSPLPNGFHAGLGNGANVEIDFDDYHFSEHHDRIPGCQYCTCRCNDVPLPMELQAKVTFLWQLAYCPEVTIPLLYNTDDANAKNYQQWHTGAWYGKKTGIECPDCPIGLEPFDLTIFFECGCDDNGEIKEFGMRVLGGPMGNDRFVCNSGSPACDPLYVFFSVKPFDTGHGYCSGQSMDSAALEVEITPRQ